MFITRDPHFTIVPKLSPVKPIPKLKPIQPKSESVVFKIPKLKLENSETDRIVL